MPSESILNTSKKLIGGITADYTAFDTDIIVFINATFSELNQMGIGGDFSIEDSSAIWTDYLPEGSLLNLVRAYIPLQVKLKFDPPSSSTVLDALKSSIAQYEFRMMVYTSEGWKKANQRSG